MKLKIFITASILTSMLACNLKKDPEPMGCRLTSIKEKHVSVYEPKFTGDVRTTSTTYEAEVIFSYDSKGNLLKVENNSVNISGSDNLTLKIVNEFNYDKNGFLTKIISKTDGRYNTSIYTRSNSVSYVYKDGLVESGTIERKRSTGEIDKKTKTFEYNNQKQLVRMVDWAWNNYESNNPANQVVYIFENGVLKNIQSQMIASDGFPIGPSDVIGPMGLIVKRKQDSEVDWIYDFDSNGRLISQDIYRNNKILMRYNRKYEPNIKEPLTALPKLKGFPDYLCLESLEQYDTEYGDYMMPTWKSQGYKSGYGLKYNLLTGEGSQLVPPSNKWVVTEKSSGNFVTNSSNFPITYNYTSYSYNIEGYNTTNPTTKLSGTYLVSRTYSYENCQ